MIATSTTQELKALRDECDWVAEQLERLQQVVVHVSPPKRSASATLSAH